MGYAGNLALDNPPYLAFQRGHDLYLNLIDLPKSLFQLASFEQFLAFACANCGQGLELLIHCNQGGSRAPTLALLLLGNLAIHLLWQSYDEGAEWLRNVYSAYNPGLEIQDLLR